MLEELKKYKYIKKSNSELESEEIMNNIFAKMWKDNGYNTIYYLGIIDYLKRMAKILGESDTFGRNDLLKLISILKTNDDAPDEIKNLVTMILDEFDYKEDN